MRNFCKCRNIKLCPFLGISVVDNVLICTLSDIDIACISIWIKNNIAYAIGVAEPVSVYVETFGTEHQDKEFISQYVRENYDLTPRGIIEDLHLLDVDYNAVSAYGHFGKHRIFVISGYPLCKSRCLHNAPDFVTNRIVKRRFFTQKAIKTARFTYFAAFYVCGLGEARVDTKNRITSEKLR